MKDLTPDKQKVKFVQEPLQYFVDVGDVKLSVNEWRGKGKPILLLHATGFHSHCWRQVIRYLPGCHIYAVDLRFHGISGDEGEPNWATLARDIQVLISELDLNNLVGVGHSLGGHLVARAAAKYPDHFEHLILIDPVIISPETMADMRKEYHGIDPKDHPVSRRRNEWLNAEEMYSHYCKRPPFNTWQSAVLRDYCNYALRKNAVNGMRQLACDPINEAAIYLRQEFNGTIYDELPLMTTPVTLLRAPATQDPVLDLSMSPTWETLADILPNCEEIYLADSNHSIPMQDPKLVAECIKRAL
jgi:pimeloyl-ACP methyl ester carboxylesterase